MKVAGFAWFIITSCGDPTHPSYCQNNDGKQVNGVFVSLDLSPTVGTSGQWDRTTAPEPPSHSPNKARREPRQPADHEPRIGAIVEWGLALTGVALTVGVVAITVHPSLIEPLGHILGEL